MKAKIKKILEKKGKQKITMLTAYDYPTAKILSSSGIDILLVGDSLGMVVLGYADTKSVTLDDMIRHASAVVRGNQGSLVVVDMPIHTTDTVENAILNCKRVLKETHADAVKIEGNPQIIHALTRMDILVMGHTGLKPQVADRFRVRGKVASEAEEIYDEALNLEAAGVFSLVLECVPASLAREITNHVKIPTFGIGAGKFCDGQVLVTSDMIGLFDDFSPKFLKRYAHVRQIIEHAVLEFKKETESEIFPAEEQTYF